MKQKHVKCPAKHANGSRNGQSTTPTVRGIAENKPLVPFRLSKARSSHTSAMAGRAWKRVISVEILVTKMLDGLTCDAYKVPMTTHKQSVALTQPQFAFLKEESRRLGITVADLIRRIIDTYREGSRKV
jgi:predicted DNA-binding ribbon-helix-helix protein